MDAKSWAGKVIADSYEILSVAGVGGMGTVFKAKQLGLERVIAVKILDPLQQDDQSVAKRFVREARSISQLSHVHIAGFYSFGLLDDSTPYIAMEWLEGKSLIEILAKESRLSSQRATHIALQIADALAYEIEVRLHNFKMADDIIGTEFADLEHHAPDSRHQIGQLKDYLREANSANPNLQIEKLKKYIKDVDLLYRKQK